MLSSGQTASLAIWLDIIEGREHPLLHGYYCTRQPNDAERIALNSAADARSIETAFFRDTFPWSNSKARHRFGTENLVKNLSKLLINLIHETYAFLSMYCETYNLTFLIISLPLIRKTASSLLDETRSELSALPKPLLEENEDPAACMLKLITSLSQDVRDCMWGGIGGFTSTRSTSRWIRENRAVYGRLKIDIRNTAPKFLPHTDSEMKKGGAAAQLVSSLEDDDEETIPTDNSRHVEVMNLTQMRQFIIK